jgi:hypothetical protein
MAKVSLENIITLNKQVAIADLNIKTVSSGEFIITFEIITNNNDSYRGDMVSRNRSHLKRTIEALLNTAFDPKVKIYENEDCEDCKEAD